ncbi:circularly permuted type 2 ATP-grasp protein [Massilia glaciei]|uniref:Molybdopterin oxidoreductase n=1 Tax=Massilia glaciei TaxID=1524097 RepID=A0A2U2HFI9_9BURK|nr:circularly permuted type 2 ATP-grasp protein [Massilia glaciei]PWF43111.1 molybdopterin oxidoreductase [Massilia glaciei]
MVQKLLDPYQVAPESYDEILDASGQPRAHWRAMLERLAAENPDAMRERVETVQRQIRENGVTYNVYADAKGVQRPWDLNALPLILPQDEWRGIEAAVIQRATLMNRILGDVYGEQQMLAEGLLPPALIHAHAGFLRQCHGMRHRDGIALHFYAVDLARAPDGRWWVITDRTQAPSGAGYALENRSIIARTFPDLMRDLKVRPLTGFFSAMRDSLVHWGRQSALRGGAGAALRESETPLIVLLTPGPYHETYYEQAFMARHLGLPLVEGGDLTVRNGMVWHKTLSGLKRVHVIVRRVDDDFCDPLELRAGSALGVGGLTEAARSGNVLIANSLGSGLLESGALLGFLPALSRRLLGEPLKMPSVATWWCGQEKALEQVVAKLDRLVIKPTFPQLRQPTVFGQDLTGEARAAFIEALRANPNNYVAQELVRLSQAPVWQPGPLGGLHGRSIGLRVYACATPNGYIVMPGGLTRVATGLDSRVITMQRGGGSKDTWVQASARPAAPRPVQRITTSADLIRDDTHLSSRMAENLFWFGRHSERCDDIARLLRVALGMLFDIDADDRGAEWPAIKSLCAWYYLIDTKDPAKGESPALAAIEPPDHPFVLTDAQVEAALMLAVVSTDVPGLARQQQALYQSASHLRERLSVDNWRALNQMEQRVADVSHPSQAEVVAILDETAASLMTLSGFALDGMNRDLGWRFLSVGRRVERLQFMCVVLQRALAMDAGGNLDWLLELSDSIVTYRSRYRARPEWLPVLDLLLLDGTNPRGMLFQIDGILGGLGKIALAYGDCGAQWLAPLRDELLALSPETDLYCGNARLIDLLSRINVASSSMSEQIGLRFFSYTGKPSDRMPT